MKNFLKYALAIVALGAFVESSYAGVIATGSTAGGGGGSGTVTSVTFTGDGVVDSATPSSAVTTSGSVVATIKTQTANKVLAGPTTGSAAASTFRSLVGADLPNPAAATLGGVNSKAAVTSNFLTQIGTDGSVSQAQPAFTDISGVATGAQLPNPSPTTLGGTESIAAVSHNFLTSISTSGVPAQAQPAFTDISGQATNAQLATQTANTLLGALTATTPSGIAVPSCADSAGNHLNWTSGTGFSCGTTSSKAGTVTSVTFTGDGTILSSTPSTAVTSSGTVTAALANQTANTLLGALTATTPSDIAVPSCTDTGGNHLNWTSGTGFSCGTTASAASLGTAISATAPSRSGEATTGLYTAGSGLVDIAVVTTGQIAEFATAGENLVAGKYQIGGANAIGFNTGDSGTAGSSLAIGVGALSGQTSSAAYNNTAAGYLAMNGTMTTAAIKNAAFGYKAGTAITSGHNNTLNGWEAGVALTSGSGNTLVGEFAGGAFTASASETIIGQAVESTLNLTGSDDIIIGVDNTTKSAATTTAGATIIGYEARGGSLDVAVGDGALTAKTGDSSDGDVAIGSNAGAALTTGDDDTFVGANAGPTVTTGGNITAIGRLAGSGILTTTSSDDIFIGVNNALTGNASDTIAIGGTGGDWVKVTGISTNTTEAATMYGSLTLTNIATGTGNYVCSTAGLLTVETTACPASDIALKNPIGLLDPSTVEQKLMNLPVATWTYKDTKTYGDHPYVGIYAQDVAKMDDRCATYDDKGKIQNYDERCVVGYLIAGNQEQQKEITAMQPSNQAAAIKDLQEQVRHLWMAFGILVTMCMFVVIGCTVKRK
jgi:hypothetical protein